MDKGTTALMSECWVLWMLRVHDSSTTAGKYQLQWNDHLQCDRRSSPNLLEKKNLYKDAMRTFWGSQRTYGRFKVLNVDFDHWGQVP